MAIATFNTHAIGIPTPTYSWEIKLPESEVWDTLIGETQNTLNLNVDNISLNDAKIRCKISNSEGTVYTREATLTVGSLPTFIFQPTSMEVPETTEVSFYGYAETDCETEVTYQWYHNGEPMVGETDWFITLTNTSDEDLGEYYVIATDCFGSIQSDTAILTFSPPTIWEAPPFLRDDFTYSSESDAELDFSNSNFVGFRGNDQTYIFRTYSPPSFHWEVEYTTSAEDLSTFPTADIRVHGAGIGTTGGNPYLHNIAGLTYYATDGDGSINPAFRAVDQDDNVIWYSGIVGLGNFNVKLTFDVVLNINETHYDLHMRIEIPNAPYPIDETVIFEQWTSTGTGLLYASVFSPWASSSTDMLLTSYYTETPI